MERVLLLLYTTVFLTTYIDNIATQSVSWELATDKPKCENSIELTCTMTGFPSCCHGTFSRVWRKLTGGVTSDLVTDGVSTDASKYREVLEDAANKTTLIIENFNQESDVTDIEYICVYAGVKNSKPIVLTGEKDCNKCAREDYGWSVLGTFIGAIIFIVIFAVKKKKDEWHGVDIAVISFVYAIIINIIIAVPVGLCICHCHCYPGWTYAFIGVGILTEVVAVYLVYKLKLDWEWIVEICLCSVVICTVIGIIFCCICICKRVQTIYAILGSTVTLQCKLTDSKENEKIRWFYINSDGEEVRYSEGRTIKTHGYSFQQNKLSITGDEAAGEYNLQITDVSESDEGKYICKCGSKILEEVKLCIKDEKKKDENDTPMVDV